MTSRKTFVADLIDECAALRKQVAELESHMTQGAFISCSQCGTGVMSRDSWNRMCPVCALAWLKQECQRQEEAICQSLGVALGFPWFKDHQEAFPGADKSWGVIIADDVAETLAERAAKRIKELETQLAAALAANMELIEELGRKDEEGGSGGD